MQNYMNGENQEQKKQKVAAVQEIWDEIKTNSLIGILEIKVFDTCLNKELTWCLLIIAPDAEYLDGIVNCAISHHLRSKSETMCILGEAFAGKNMISVGVLPDELEEMLGDFSLDREMMLRQMAYLKEEISEKRKVEAAEICSETEMFRECGLDEEVNEFLEFIEVSDSVLAKKIKDINNV